MHRKVADTINIHIAPIEIDIYIYIHEYRSSPSP